jgi:hypothetical protein
VVGAIVADFAKYFSGLSSIFFDCSMLMRVWLLLLSWEEEEEE